MTLLTGVDAIVVNQVFSVILSNIIEVETRGKCHLTGTAIIDCDCSKGINSVFPPLVFSTMTVDEEELDLVI